MQETGHNSSNLAWTLALLIVVGLAGGLYWRTNRVWATHYNQIELRADSLLSVKFHLEDDIRDLKSQLETAADDKVYFDKRLNQFHSMLSRQDQQLDKVQQARLSQTNSIRLLKQQGDSLALIRDSLENQLAASRDKIGWLTDANKLLIGQNQDLEQEVRKLTTDMAGKVPRTTLTGNAFLVEPRKANTKVTAKARKTRSLLISCMVPAELQLEGRQEVFLSLTDEKGETMIPAIRTTTVELPDLNDVIPVHAAQMVSFTQVPQRIVFQISPANTWRAGLYRASIYTREAFLGTVEFRLRDSFWFF
ncbi:coiled-coil domain-containing protein [Spirosoma aerolatum]|uniref:hypothetical protein n=1 Tax=Spirosoma aerolatum TaxID=1211326 RepID=UPI0009AE6444|nr:hypothetical protein [Spirosoma aerolatum]